MINFPISVCAVIKSKKDSNKFIAVHRKENSEKICFPGGKVDQGENILEAVTREIYEETGLVILLSELQPIYTGLCEGDKEYLTTVFLAHIDEDAILNSSESEMKPFWTNEEHFTKNNSFPIFNSKIFETLKIIQK